jgi:hypothetical protein
MQGLERGRGLGRKEGREEGRRVALLDIARQLHEQAGVTGMRPTPASVPTAAPGERTTQEPANDDKGTPPNGDIAEHMERVAQAIGDDNAVRILAIAHRKDLSGEGKMQEILRVDSRFAGKDSPEWAVLLNVSAAAVRGYGTWKDLQRRKKSEN